MLHYFHYGEPEHIKQFFEDGSIQIGTLRAYDTATHGQAIGDDQEGLSFTTLTDDVVANLRSNNQPIPPHLEEHYGIGCSGNVVQVTNVSFNYAIFCVSRCLHQVLCKDFKRSYAAAIYIDKPFVFFSELTKAFERSELSDNVTFRHVSDMTYSGRSFQGLDDFAECFIKEERYSNQFETRAIWNAGSEPPPFFRFKAPDALRGCRPVLWKDMPNYPPETSQDVVMAQMTKAYFACSKPRYLMS